MYLKNIEIKNYGPIENLIYDCPFDNEKPIPIIVVGENGAGKTLFLANIIDCIIELKRLKYADLKEVPTNKYLKLGKKDYINTLKDFLFIHIDFEHDKQQGYYVDFAISSNKDKFLQKYRKEDFKHVNFDFPKFIEYGYFKEANASIEVLKAFENQIFLYFPFSRFEHPAWLIKNAEIGFSMQEKFIEQVEGNIIKTNVVNELEEWILNVILDYELYEKQIINLNTVAQQLQPEEQRNLLQSFGSLIQILPQEEQTKLSSNNSSIFQLLKILPQEEVKKIFQSLAINLQIFAGYSGKNTTTRSLINEILTTIYKSKNSKIQSARIGISDKNYRRIAVLINEQGKQEREIAPTLSHLSSGELMIFGLFCSILKEYDKINIEPATRLEQISGIVVIDEIDLHLHIDLQRLVLPSLMKKFPNVQFILSTHSPLFLFGCEQYFPSLQIINLPIGVTQNINDFSEVQKSYEIFIDKFKNFKIAYETIDNKLKKITKTIVITEGKTDWKHLKAALKRFQLENKYKSLDIEFLEYEDEIQMSEGELLSICQQYSKTKQPKKIICIFDRDTKIVSQVEFNNSYKCWGNNVYSFAIPKPKFREQYKYISIEFYYKDDNIKTKTIDNKRLWFTNEIKKTVEPSLTFKDKSTTSFTVRENPIQEEEFDKKIYDQDIKLIKENGLDVAISKSSFAQSILNETKNFDCFDITEFGLIFDIINEINNL